MSRQPQSHTRPSKRLKNTHPDDLVFAYVRQTHAHAHAYTRAHFHAHAAAPPRQVQWPDHLPCGARRR